jgi:hypothetical protein
MINSWNRLEKSEYGCYTVHVVTCSAGIAAGEKQDTTATFLADATGSGAKILSGAVPPIVVDQGLH